MHGKCLFISVVADSLVGTSEPMRVLLVECSVGVGLFLTHVVVRGFIAVVQHDLLEHQVFEVLLTQRVLLKVKVECANGRGGWLVVREMQLLEVRVLKRVLDGDTVIRIVGQHLLKQIDGVGVSALEQLFEVLAVTLGQLLDEIPVLLVFDFGDQLGLRISQQLRDHLKLILLGAGRQQRLADNELGEDAADGPDVDRTGVLLPG